MRPASLMFAAVLLAACSDEQSALQDAPPPQQELAQPSPGAQQPAREKADIAAAEAKPKPPDPCDLSGYDMKKMTADMHERLVKACENSKQ